MGEQQHKQHQHTDEVEDELVPAKTESAEAFDIDDVLNDIDDVLEENAEEFVRGYVQKGGQ